jgi:uncharacterized SAM-binding protein YcdF (DUF218 family)
MCCYTRKILLALGELRLPQDILEDARALYDFNQLHHELRPCSVGIGLSSHDPGVPDVTAALFHRGAFPLIVFTGANAPTTRDRFPGGEAVHYRQRAIELGVPSEAILIEPRATNTRENIEFSRQLMAEHGLQAESAVLICRPYQQRRAYATCRQVWPALDVICASDPRPLDDYIDGFGDPGHVISMMVGDTQRVIEYPRLGHAIPQEVPRPIEAALKRLIAAGFTDRLLPAATRTSRWTGSSPVL